jgi:hypothetical protein
MTTKNEMIEIIRAENPEGLRTGSDEAGYVDLTPSEYETQIAAWADARLAKQAADKESKDALDAAKAKLAAIGLTVEDLKALGF